VFCLFSRLEVFVNIDWDNLEGNAGGVQQFGAAWRSRSENQSHSDAMLHSIWLPAAYGFSSPSSSARDDRAVS
jgi:hypothetical protein